MSSRGEKIHRLSLQSRENIKNDLGEDIPNPKWSDVTLCWASIDPKGGGEYEQADKTNAKLNFEIEIYNIKGKTDQITSEMRFYSSLFGDVYNIDSYIKTRVQRDRVIICQCTSDESRENVEDA